MGYKHDGKRRYPGPNRIMGRVFEGVYLFSKRIGMACVGWDIACTLDINQFNGKQLNQ
jgi:hypothetical protein